MITLFALLPGAGSRFMSGQSTSERLLGAGVVLLILGVRFYFWWSRRR